jgi:hypothetical protein
MRRDHRRRAFRDRYAELQALSAGVFGLRAQTTDYQREVRDRLHLPFELLSDAGLEPKAALRLPTFTAAGMERYRRLTLAVDDQRIAKAFHPALPPDRSATDALQWLRANASPLWFVPRDKLRLLTPADDLATCTFNEHVIRHRFCPACGIHPFGEGADPAGNKMAAISVRGLEGVDIAALLVQRFAGRSL